MQQDLGCAIGFSYSKQVLCNMYESMALISAFKCKQIVYKVANTAMHFLMSKILLLDSGALSL